MVIPNANSMYPRFVRTTLHPLLRALGSAIWAVSLILTSQIALSAPTTDENGRSTPSAEIERRIAELEESEASGDNQRADDLERLRQALIKNSIAERSIQLSDEYRTATENPETYASQTRLPELPVLREKVILAADRPQLQAWIVEHEIALATLTSRRENIEIESRAARSADDQLELAKLRAATPRAKGALTTSLEERSPQQILDLSSEDARSARIRMLENRELSRPVRLAAWQKELDSISTQVGLATRQLKLLQSRSAEVQQEQANTRELKIRQLLTQIPKEETTHLAYGDDVLQRSLELQELTLKQEAIDQEVLATRQDRTRLKQRYTSLTQQLDLFQFGTSPEFGAALRAQRDQIVGTVEISNRVAELEAQITESRLRQFRLDDLQQVLRLKAPSNTEYPTAAELEKIDNTLVDELAIGYARYVQKLNSLAFDDKAYVNDSKSYASLLDQNLLWMPSTSAVGTEHLTTLPGAIAWLASPNKWLTAMKESAAQFSSRPLPILILLLICAVLVQRRPQFKQTLLDMNGRVGKVNRDGHSLTPVAIMITMLLAAPGPLAMYIGSLLTTSPTAFGGALAKSLSYAAILYFVLGLLRQCVRPNGLGELHFGWKPATIAALRANMPWFMALFVPLLAINLFIDISGTADIRDGFGRIAFILATLLLAFFAYRVMSPERGVFGDAANSQSSPWHTRFLSFPFLVLLPVAVGVLSVSGYHYTAVQLDAYLLNSLALILIALLIFYTAERGIAVNERRLALERIRAKRAASLARNEENLRNQDSETATPREEVPIEIDVEEIDLQTISNQTRELLRVVIGIGLGIALWNLWSDFLPAVQALSNVHLWGGVIAPDGESISGDVTLWAMLLAIATAALTFVAGRNIPSLLEVTLLSRLTLESGTSYAITTLARYIIVIAGSVITLQLLGAEWSKLQWLIAALSVGLGFGLQEIVANFVSGIVLLLVRPIRFGDTVTVGDQFGTVSRIRIRATTMVDWDRREIVIPNKTFITERLVNWTLTDSITRSIIHIGVAYGSDVELTERLLLKIAAAEEDVLAEPTPVAVFMSFGDSSLNFELRVFVKGVRDLVPVKHALNVAIERTFQEHGIEIPFPQRNLHLDSKPIEVQIVQPHNSDPNSTK